MTLGEGINDNSKNFVGTSTTGIDEGEKALVEQKSQGQFPTGYHYAQQELELSKKNLF